MKRILFVTIAFGLGACAGAGGDPEGSEPSGVGAAPGNGANDTVASSATAPAPSAPREASPAAEATTAPDAAPSLAAGRPTAALDAAERIQGYSLPGGVVLDDGRVVSEEEARTGLAPKANLFFTKRLVGSLTQVSSMSLSPATPSTHVCALSLVWGALYGSGSQVYVSNVGSIWQMATVPVGTTSRVTMEAACYPLSAFSASDGGSAWAPSGVFDATVPGSGKVSTNCWQGDAGTFLTGIGGRFSGSGEFARVSENATTQNPSWVTIQSLQSGTHVAEAHSLFVGVGGGSHVPQFIGPNGVGNITTAGEWTYDFEGSDSFHFAATVMASTTDAFCYLTKVTGNWGDANSWVQILPDSSSRWTLKASAGGSNSVHAVAACYKLQQ